MFYLLPKRHNFTQAVEECRNASGVLADVTSEQRTDALSQMLAGVSVDAALVGLRRRNETSFRSPNGESWSSFCSELINTYLPTLDSSEAQLKNKVMSGRMIITYFRWWNESVEKLDLLWSPFCNQRLLSNHPQGAELPAAHLNSTCLFTVLCYFIWIIITETLVSIPQEIP